MNAVWVILGSGLVCLMLFAGLQKGIYKRNEITAARMIERPYFRKDM